MQALVLALALLASPRPPAPPPAQGPRLPPPPPPVAGAPGPLTVAASFQHLLSGATGPLKATWPSLVHDRAHDETFVIADGFVRIYGTTGMEVYRFGDDGALGEISGVAVLDGGDLVVLARLDGRRQLLRCNFRGELLGPVVPSGVPAGFADLEPDRVAARGGALYLVDSSSMRVLVLGPDGAFRRGVRLRDLVTAALPQERVSGLDGFSADAAGNLYFTMTTLFGAGVASPSGGVRFFGARGSRPGTFNIIGGVDADEAGNVYVTDRLRAVVSVWSPDLKHLGDFGYRGDGPENLITPNEIAAGNGRVYVAQAGRRGVKAFKVRLLAPGERVPEREPESRRRGPGGIAMRPGRAP